MFFCCETDKVDDVKLCKIYEAIIRKKARVSIVEGGKVFYGMETNPILLLGSVSYTQCKRQQRELMKTIFVPSQRTRSPSHNCQSCNKSLCGTNEYGIGNETKLIGMLCQLDSIHPPFHTRPFICEVVRGCLSLALLHTHILTDALSPSLGISYAHSHTSKHTHTIFM